jgi:hypothetical protein
MFIWQHDCFKRWTSGQLGATSHLALFETVGKAIARICMSREGEFQDSNTEKTLKKPTIP